MNFLGKNAQNTKKVLHFALHVCYKLCEFLCACKKVPMIAQYTVVKLLKISFKAAEDLIMRDLCTDSIKIKPRLL